jgi:tetraacyldisaccharide 4'-kinase
MCGESKCDRLNHETDALRWAHLTLMDERLYLDVISGRQRGFAAGAARAGLSLLTPFYRAGVVTRDRIYCSGWKHSQRVAVRVVSVGNLTTGGTGKTPVVAWLIDWLASRNCRGCIISRGYRSLDERGNDELRVLEQLCPGTPHLQNRDRVAAARQALAEHRPDVLVLDDGFQHRRLARDVDLVLIDALNPWGHGRLLPRGLLREPRSALRRAGALLLTRSDQIDDVQREHLKSEIRRFTDAPIAEIAFRPHQWLALDGSTLPLEDLQGQSLLGFCGIGNPEGFRRTLQDAGQPGVPLEAFPDHHHYRKADLERLREQAQGHSASALVTTQKDLVKLEPSWLAGVPVWALAIRAEVITGADELEQVLAEALGETGGSRSGYSQTAAG